MRMCCATTVRRAERRSWRPHRQRRSPRPCRPASAPTATARSSRRRAACHPQPEARDHGVRHQKHDAHPDQVARVDEEAGPVRAGQVVVDPLALTMLRHPATMKAMPPTGPRHAPTGTPGRPQPIPRPPKRPTAPPRAGRPPVDAPRTSARGKRGQPRRFVPIEGTEYGSVNAARRTGPRAVPARPGRRARAAGGATSTAATAAPHRQEAENEAKDERRADIASAGQTRRWGVHDSVTVKFGPPSSCRSAAVTCQPLAKPSTSWDVPRSTAWEPGAAPGPGVATAFHPLLLLWPNTNSNGWVAPVTDAVSVSMCDAVWVTVGAAPGWVADSVGVPAAVGDAAGAAAARSRVERELVEVPSGARRWRAGARRVVADGRLTTCAPAESLIPWRRARTGPLAPRRRRAPMT